MNLLVTGCAGFIGARVTGQLLARGDTVTGVDNLNDYYAPALKEHRLAGLRGHPGFTFRRLDIEDAAALAEVFREHRFDAVLNLAARAGVRASVEHPHVYWTTNGTGTLNLLEEMRRHGVAKLVLASTSSLYAGQPLPWREDLPVNQPVSPYAASKKAAEMMAYTYHHLHRLDVSVVRYFTVFGPADRPDMAIFRFIRAVLTGRPITLYGDGSQSRDFTFVDDIAAGTIAALLPLGYEVINLGGGRQPVSLLQILEFLGQRLGREPQIRFAPRHPADFQDSWADIAKARRLLDWEPRTSLWDGLDQALAWHRQNHPWLDSCD